jgi:hypothetical protein
MSLAEQPRRASFIVSEANGGRSRESAVLQGPHGTLIAAGTVLRDLGDGVVRRINEGSTPVGILVQCGPQIPLGGPFALYPCSYIARDAVVMRGELTYNADLPEDSQDINTKLETLGIIVR